MTRALKDNRLDGSSGPVSDVRLGTDLVFVPRLRLAYGRFGAAFFERLLTVQEWEYCQGKTKRDTDTQVLARPVFQKVAARIAVKEAVAKALGCGLNGLGWGQGVHWQDIEMRSIPQMPPQLVLTGNALRFAETLEIQEWKISLSHDGDYALATVMGLVVVSGTCSIH